MSRRNKVLLIAAAFFALAAMQKILFPFDTEAVSASVAVRPEIMFVGGGFEITNTLLTAWLAMLILTLLTFFATRRMSLVPGGLQNALELAIEAILNLCESVAGSRGRQFFPIVATIFLFVVVSNLLGLIPGFGPVGTLTLPEGAHAPKGLLTFDLPPVFAPQEEEEHGPIVLAPFFRSPSTDINFPLSLALISVILTQIYGMQALGILAYWGKFLNFKRLGVFVLGLFRGQARIGEFLYGLLDVFIGLIELVSEMGKILSFTFRLFGNIFAGEVVLLIMSFLFLALPLVFYGLEVFVGVIQGFVFGILTLAFMTIATTPHAGAEHH